MMGNSFPPTRVEQVGLLELVLGLPALLRPSGTLSVFICTMGVQHKRPGQLEGGQKRWPTGMASREVEDRSHRSTWCLLSTVDGDRGPGLRPPGHGNQRQAGEKASREAREGGEARDAVSRRGSPVRPEELHGVQPPGSAVT